MEAEEIAGSLLNQELVSGGFHQVYPGHGEENTYLYRISSLDENVMAKAFNVLKRLSEDENFKFQGDLSQFKTSIQSTPYLISKGGQLGLCSREFAEKCIDRFERAAFFGSPPSSSISHTRRDEDKELLAGMAAAFTLCNIGFQIVNGLISGTASWGMGKLIDTLFNKDKPNIKVLIDQSVDELKAYFKLAIDEAFLKNRKKNLTAATEAVEKTVNDYNALVEKYREEPNQPALVEMRQAVYNRVMDLLTAAKVMPGATGVPAYFLAISTYGAILEELKIPERYTNELKEALQFTLKNCYQICNPYLQKMETRTYVRYTGLPIGSGPLQTHFEVYFVDEGKKVDGINYFGVRDGLYPDHDVWPEGEAAIRDKIIAYENKRLQEVTNALKIEETLKSWETLIKKNDPSYQEVLGKKTLTEFLRSESELFPLVLFEAHEFYGPREGFQEGEYPYISSTTIRNDTVSSFKLKEGYKAHLYNAANFQKTHGDKIFTQSNNSLVRDSLGQDALSSFKVTKE